MIPGWIENVSKRMPVMNGFVSIYPSFYSKANLKISSSSTMVNKLPQNPSGVVSHIFPSFSYFEAVSCGA
jgi:hypothetical protein